MPPKYYAFIDGEQKGPFSLDRLIDIGVRPSTYVWSKDMEDWQRADSVEEIRNLFRHHLENKRENTLTQVQPATPSEATTGKPENVVTQQRMGFPLPETEENIDLDSPPQVSLTLAVLSLLLCFPPTGIAAVIYAYKAQKTWDEATKWRDNTKDASEGLRRKAHEYERLSKMWLGLTVAFGIIFWTLLFSVR